ncbi:MAG: alcohol dehydrogenase catalytic domain-containing protein [Thermoplasmata archaeon]
MKAAVVYEPMGNENLRIEEVAEPQMEREKVIVNVRKAGLNPVDYNTINGNIVYRVSPVPHIPGTEIYGVIDHDTEKFKKNDRVVIYNRLFDGVCNQCISGNEHLCENGGLWGVSSNGGYSEKISIDEKNVFRVPDNVSDEVASSITVSALTAYRALIRAGGELGQKILVYGASGNTGMFTIQLASIMGYEVYAVSRKKWLEEFGAIETFESDKIPEEMKFDMIINPLGTMFWDNALAHLSTRGTMVTYGILTGRKGNIDIAQIYTGERRIIGSTGGTRKDLTDLLKLMRIHDLRVKISREFKLDDMQKALSFYSEPHDGRILISMKGP